MTSNVKSVSIQLCDPSRDWIQRIRDGYLVIVSTHSQGAPVSCIVLDKLVREGIVRTQVAALAIVTYIEHRSSDILVYLSIYIRVS
jgi:hypothetical protein